VKADFLKGDTMRAKKHWILVVMLAICTSVMFAASERNPLTSPQGAYPVEQGDTLEDLESTGVLVSLTPKAELYGSTPEKLQADIESHLRRCGIKVLPAHEISKTLGMPLLVISADCQMRDDGRPNEICGGSAQIFFVQNVFLQRNPKTLCRAVTWIDFKTFTVERINLEKTVRESIENMVDEFCNEFLTANPKPKDEQNNK
jgi:hypothetical protein